MSGSCSHDCECQAARLALGLIVQFVSIIIAGLRSEMLLHSSSPAH